MSEEVKPEPIPRPTGPQPVQDVYHDEHGVIRFRPNMIVRDMLDHSTPLGFDMNRIAMANYDRADRVQFAQLIGYSVAGFSDLQSYVSDEDYAVAEQKIETRNNASLTEQLEARNLVLKSALKDLQQGIRHLYHSLPWDEEHN